MEEEDGARIRSLPSRACSSIALLILFARWSFANRKGGRLMKAAERNVVSRILPMVIEFALKTKRLDFVIYSQADTTRTSFGSVIGQGGVGSMHTY